MNEREFALEQVNTALPVFREINELYYAANSLNQQAMAVAADEDRYRQKTKKAFKWNFGYEGVGAILGWNVPILVLQVLGMRTPQILAIAGAVAGGFLGHRLKKKLLDKKHQSTNQQIDSMKPQMEQISREIYRVTTENQEQINLMPRDYRYYDAVSFFENALTNGRADSLKEAINLYEEHIHRQNMELNSRQILHQNRMQSEMLANIEQSAQQAAVNTGITATFTILQYL